jgi:hypothetical protein
MTMIPSASRIATRWLRGSVAWTPEYLQALIDAVVGDPSGWGEGSPAARVLRKMVQSAKYGNIDPFPIEELWPYLEDQGVDADELRLMRGVPLPHAERTKKGPSFPEAWAHFERVTEKSTILTGINLDDPDMDRLVPALEAIMKAVGHLPQHADRLWKSQVKKVRLRAKARGSEDASWETRGVLSVSLNRALPVDSWREFIVHELGHALEEKLHLNVAGSRELPYGKPPFISDYAEVNASEDFAETFRAFELEPGHLRSKAPLKFEDMANRAR